MLKEEQVIVFCELKKNKATGFKSLVVYEQN
jgi:hypothetical protein